jgi:hypothetical protein
MLKHAHTTVLKHTVNNRCCCVVVCNMVAQEKRDSNTQWQQHSGKWQAGQWHDRNRGASSSAVAPVQRGGWFSKCQRLCEAVLHGHEATAVDLAHEFYAGSEQL